MNENTKKTVKVAGAVSGGALLAFVAVSATAVGLVWLVVKQMEELE